MYHFNMCIITQTTIRRHVELDVNVRPIVFRRYNAKYYCVGKEKNNKKTEYLTSSVSAEDTML